MRAIGVIIHFGANVSVTPLQNDMWRHVMRKKTRKHNWNNELFNKK